MALATVLLPKIYRIPTFAEGANPRFNHLLVKGDEPRFLHMRLSGMHAEARETSAKLINVRHDC